MKYKKNITGHCLVLVLALPNVVSAADFNIAAKVNFSNLHPDVVTVKVQCFVAPSDKLLSEEIIGVGNTIVKIPSNGSLNQTVQVKFDSNKGKNPADATHLGCNIFLKDLKGTEALPLRSTDNGCKKKENFWKCSLPEKQLTNLIRDPLP